MKKGNKIENLFEFGEKPSLEEVLLARENRWKIQEQLAKKYSLPILTFKLNIPGPVKNNRTIYEVFNKGYNQIKHMLRENGWNVVFEKHWNFSTGPEYICVVNTQDPIELKRKTIELEESFLGRIYDIDIVVEGHNQIVQITRTKLGFDERKCFICNNSAKICGRSRAHSIEEIQMKLSEIILTHMD